MLTPIESAVIADDKVPLASTPSRDLGAKETQVIHSLATKKNRRTYTVKDGITRREFVTVSSGAAAIAATGTGSSAALAAPSEPDAPDAGALHPRNPMSTADEIIPGMRAQGEGVKKVYVESEYAPLKACLFGNSYTLEMPDPDSPESIARLFEGSDPELVAYLRSVKNTHLKDSDPKKYDALVAESNAVAETYRKEGVHVVRNEGPMPEEVLKYATGWCGTKQLSTYGQSAFEVFGHCLVNLYEVPPVQWIEMTHREATVAMVENDPEAIWLSMPVPYPAFDIDPGPFLSPGDPRILPGTVVIGIGVSDPSHIKDRSKPRSSGSELGAEILRRMLKPFGWKVEVVYFDSKLSYHIDCVMSVLDEGLLAMPKNALWTPLPKEFQDWEVMDVDVEDLKIGACNNVPLGDKRLVITNGTKRYAKDMEKRGWTVIEVPYQETYKLFGSGIHCSTASIWRES